MRREIERSHHIVIINYSVHPNNGWSPKFWTSWKIKYGYAPKNKQTNLHLIIQNFQRMIIWYLIDSKPNKHTIHNFNNDMVFARIIFYWKKTLYSQCTNNDFNYINWAKDINYNDDDSDEVWNVYTCPMMMITELSMNSDIYFINHNHVYTSPYIHEKCKMCIINSKWRENSNENT